MKCFLKTSKGRKPRAHSSKQRSCVLLAFLILLLFSCAKKEPEVDFKPIQIRWNLAEGEDETQMPRKDECVILLTARLMAEPAVQASTAGELSYEVTYSRSPENPEILKFDGICRDLSIMDKPECRWEATCDADCKIVVNFHNGD
ncbi:MULTISPECIES: hypothetical protein [unclassified Fibrobacter]|uniref:hypothetical protein n=1 Tax=unclassified Fibrobacter TaxID=2634177 RepID=UPI000934FC82|nr:MULTISPECIES: hypothetical protein [unclassified Fibrobacter]